MSLNNVNSSENRGKQNSGGYICSYHTNFVRYSTFSNNTSYYSICIGLSSKTHYISQCNVIGNTQNQSYD